MLLAGKKVVVVGGSSGIGLSTAEMAKREGAEIIIASRNAERLDMAAVKLNAGFLLCLTEYAQKWTALVCQSASLKI